MSPEPKLDLCPLLAGFGLDEGKLRIASANQLLPFCCNQRGDIFFLCRDFPGGVVVVRHAPGDYPAGKQSDVFTAEFRVTRVPRCSSIKRRVRSRSRPMIRLRQTTCGARSSTMGGR